MTEMTDMDFELVYPENTPPENTCVVSTNTVKLKLVVASDGIMVDKNTNGSEYDPIVDRTIISVNKTNTPSKSKIAPVSIVNGKKIKITQQMIESTYGKLRVIIKDMVVDVDNIGIIVGYALQISNGSLISSKVYKIELALCIIRKLIDECVVDLGMRRILHAMVESIVPELINTIQGLPNILSKIWANCKCCSCG
jgi:hypothetical protein